MDGDVRTIVDLTEEDGPFPDGRMPEPAFISDDMDWVLCFGEVEIRMTYAQWDKVVSAYMAWINTVGSGDRCEIEKWAALSPPQYPWEPNKNPRRRVIRTGLD